MVRIGLPSTMAAKQCDFREIDKNNGQKKNLWCSAWLDVIVVITWITEKGKRSENIVLRDCFEKRKKPGFVHCLKCDCDISYKSKGRKSLVDHVNCDKHIKNVRLTFENETLGSMGLPVSFSATVLLSF